MTSPDARELALNPEWIPHAFEEDTDLDFVLVPRASRSNLVFLTDGQMRGAYAKTKAPVTAVKNEASVLKDAPLHFVFHSSFCCSTLLARAVEKKGTSASLSEPNILVNLAEQMIAGQSGTRERLELALQLLGRPFEPGETMIIKPSSFANRLAEPILRLRTQSRGVLLYSDAKTFLASVVRRGLLGRINARKLYVNLRSWSALDFGFSESEIFEQTDLQIAALSWLMQMAHFDRLFTTFGADRLIILDAADLLANPVTELERVQSFFGLGFRHEEVEAIVSGPVFSRHSKDRGRDYGQKAREEDHNALLKAHSDELEMVLKWLSAVAGHLGVPMNPGSQP